MKKRLRKKKRLGEFQEFGFYLDAEYDEIKDESKFDDFIDRVLDMIEDNGFVCGGKFLEEQFDGFLSLSNPSLELESQKKALLESLKSISEIKKAEVSENVDAWYGPFRD